MNAARRPDGTPPARMVGETADAPAAMNAGRRPDGTPGGA